jgi:hypothetical protein
MVSGPSDVILSLSKDPEWCAEGVHIEGENRGACYYL